MDELAAAQHIGKRVLIGIKNIDKDDNLLDKKQYYGEIIRINQKEGIVVRLHGTQDEMNLPPRLEALEPAEPGDYRLRSTGEVVVDPDYISTWTVNR